jgi:toxin YoeB
MSYRLDFVPAVSKTIAKYKKSNPNLFKKLDKILQDIQQHPKTGIGHPEPLVGGDGITYSRHISAHRRIIYDIYEESIRVLVLDLDSHYGDK